MFEVCFPGLPLLRHGQTGAPNLVCLTLRRVEAENRKESCQASFHWSRTSGTRG